MKKISIIIPSYNSYKTLEWTLNSLKDQNRPELVGEILVVDSSDDRETKLLCSRTENEGIRWIHLPTKTIPAIARNIGAQEAKEEVLAFIDSDVYLAADWVEMVIEQYEHGVQMGGGAVLMPPFQRDKTIPWAQYFLQFNETMDSGNIRRVQFLPSCNMFCDKNIFFRMNGFPEIRASEDTLFFLKASKIAPVTFVPQAKAYHIFRESISSFLKNQKLLGQYILYYRRIHWAQKFYYHGLWPLLFFPAFITIKFWKITTRILQRKPSLFLRYVQSFPYILLGLGAWSMGFVSEIFKSHSNDKNNPLNIPKNNSNILNILNVRYHNIFVNEALEFCLSKIENKIKSNVFFLNLDALHKAQKYKYYRTLLNFAPLVLPDGIGLKLATSFFGNRMKDNCNGTDFCPLLMENCAKHSYKIFLFGGEVGVATRAEIILKKRFPGIQIVGTENGFASKEKVIEKINRCGADVLFVGLGIPTQEKWIAENFGQLNVILCLGVGALFDWISGHRKRCSPFLRTLNLEWFWRILIEPERMVKRYIVEGVPFLLTIFFHHYWPDLMIKAGRSIHLRKQRV